MTTRTLAAVALLVAGAARADESQIRLREGPGRELVLAHCAMCHSVDYVPMNSPFLDRKGWEASVGKMIKVMGAPIPADDAAKIVEYLATYYGPTAPPAAAAAAPAPALARAIEPPQRTPELLARGKASYAAFCAACHGAAGAGDGPAAKALRPPPPDLTALTAGAPGIFEVLGRGVKGTAMVPFTHLPEQDRWAIAHFVESLRDARR